MPRFTDEEEIPGVVEDADSNTAPKFASKAAKVETAG
jgi:hypothetical protein